MFASIPPHPFIVRYRRSYIVEDQLCIIMDHCAGKCLCSFCLFFSLLLSPVLYSSVSFPLFICLFIAYSFVSFFYLFLSLFLYCFVSFVYILLSPFRSLFLSFCLFVCLLLSILVSLLLSLLVSLLLSLRLSLFFCLLLSLRLSPPVSFLNRFSSLCVSSSDFLNVVFFSSFFCFLVSPFVSSFNSSILHILLSLVDFLLSPFV